MLRFFAIKVKKTSILLKRSDQSGNAGTKRDSG
jgi:hypothetical protein